MSFGLQLSPFRSGTPRAMWEHFPSGPGRARGSWGMSRLQSPGPLVPLLQMLTAFLNKQGFCCVPGSQGGFLASFYLPVGHQETPAPPKP